MSNERERARQEIHRIFGGTETSGALWRSLFDHSFQFIGLVSVDGVLLEANDTALAAIGRTRDEVLGRPFWELPWWAHSEAAVARLKDGVARARAGEFVRFETTHMNADRQTIAVDFSLTPVRGEDGRVLFLIPEGRDITERKRHERERAFVAEAGRLLSESLDRNTIFERLAHHLVAELADLCVISFVERGGATPVAVAHRDPTRAAEARALAAEFTREPGTEHCVSSVMASRHAELYPRVGAAWDGAPVGKGFPRLLHEMGARSFMCVPLRTRGRVLGVVTLVATAPGRRYSAHDLALAEDLAHRAAVTIENVHLYEEARRAVAARDELVASVSHDLRSPLNAIVLNAALVTRSGTPAAKYGEVIKRVADSMNVLIQDLLDLAKIEAGHFALGTEPCDPGALVSDAIELLEVQAGAKGIRLRKELSDDPTRVRCEPRRVLRVFSNLVGNAIKFSPEGAEIVLRVKRAGREVQFEVQDSGPGIPAEEIDHLFDRSWLTRKATASGNGLGLLIARGIVQAHGGRIWLESTPGVGTTFFFTLPPEQ